MKLIKMGCQVDVGVKSLPSTHKVSSITSTKDNRHHKTMEV